MSDSGKHLLLGAGLAGGIYLVFCWITERKPTWGGFFGSVAIGGVFALTPDLLEPALHPNHRQFFHSVTALGLLGYGNYRVLISNRLNPEQKLALAVASTGYVSHLLMDSATPKSLPLI